jgi:hypothetical protein
MPPPLVVWSGPVAEFQVRGATLEGASRIFLACRGDKVPGDPYCPAVGQKYEQSPALVFKKAGVPDDGQPLVLAAFSAGGSTFRRLLAHREYRDRTTAVLLFDATYTASWLNKARRETPPIAPFVEYAVDVVGDPGKLLVATASPNPNGQWGTGIDNLRALRKEIEKRTGRHFAKMDGFFGISPLPDAAYRLGNVIIAEFPPKPLGHGGHATKLSPEVFAKILAPFLGAGIPKSSPAKGGGGGVTLDLPAPRRRGSRALAIAAAVAAAAAAVLAVVLRRR